MASARPCARVPTVRPDTSELRAAPTVSQPVSGGVHPTMGWLSLAVGGRLKTVAPAGRPAKGGWGDFDGAHTFVSSAVNGTERSGESAMSTERSGTDRRGAVAGT